MLQMKGGIPSRHDMRKLFIDEMLERVYLQRHRFMIYKGFRADRLKKKQMVYWTQKLEKMISSEDYQMARESTKIIMDSSPAPV